MKCLLMVFLVACGMAVAGEITVIPSTQKTSADLGLEFVCENVEIDQDSDIVIQGTVTNTGDQEYARVKVVFTVKDKDGGFINRKDILADPDTIGVEEVGYVETFIGTKNKIPAVVEYTVQGRIQGGRQRAARSPERESAPQVFPQENAPSASGEQFSVSDLLVKPMPFGDFMAIQGRITNNSGKGYRVSLFKMSFFDSDNKLLGSADIALQNLGEGETVTFDAMTQDNVANWKSHSLRLDMGMQ